MQRPVGVLVGLLVASVVIVIATREWRPWGEIIDPTPQVARATGSESNPTPDQNEVPEEQATGEEQGPLITLEHPADFFSGALHGLTAPFMLLISFFTHDARMYAFENVGPRYDLGFLLGFMMWLVVGWSRRSS